jgi:fatty-acid desaturase
MATISTARMVSGPESDASRGNVRWVPAKSIWTLAMLAVAVIGAPLTFTWDALALFLLTTTITICAGHSVGMHRLLIHRSFAAPKWLERTLVYLGTLVGMAGPFGMIAAHDIRDWAQRQADCHDLYAHRKAFFRDAWWQMHCAVALDNPPRFDIEPEVKDDWFYRFIERTWMLQQVPWALLFFAIGGIGWVVWGIALRVSMSLHGHWLVGHFAHRRGRQNWAVDGVAVQGYNIPNVSLLTFGEGWHGNHHAYPGSARLGLEKGELDPGWWLIRTLAFLGLAWNVKQPEHVGEREGLRRIDTSKRRYPKKLSLFAAWAAATVTGAAMLGLLLNPAEMLDVAGWRLPTSADFPGLLNLVWIIGGPAAAFILLTGVPTIRWTLRDSETDQAHGLWFYVSMASSLGLICSLIGGPGFVFVYLFFLPPAAAAGLAFGLMNKRAIRKFLARQKELHQAS